MRFRAAPSAARRRRLVGPVGLAVAASLTIGVLQGVPAAAAPGSPAEVAAAAEERAREAAATEAPPAEPPRDAEPPAFDSSSDLSDPVEPDEFALAWAQAERTGQPVELDSQTTETTISRVQPDGTVEVESTAGPVRTQVDGEWVDVDTTLEVTGAGVRPTAVTGEITFSAGGTAPMAELGDGEGRSVSFDWAGVLPEPVLDGDTATYPDVLPDTDLVLTATRQGFTQHLVVKERPDAATLDELSSLSFPMTTEGARVTETGGGQLTVLDEEGGLIGGAAAPLMWDARTNKRTGDPVAVEQMGIDVTPPVEAGTDATLVLRPGEDFLTDPDTVYPVTIDPTQALGALGDAFVQSNYSTAQGGSTELRAGTYDGPTAARSYLRFDVAPVKNRVVQGATLSLWEFHSWSCSPRWVDIRNVGGFDPNTITWGSQPAIGSIVANANVAYGYSTACPDNWVNFNLTNWVAHYADARNGTGNVMPLGVFANEDDVYAWKKFHSGNAGTNVPKLTFTYDGNCDQYKGLKICGDVRAKYYALGGLNSYLGVPTNSTTATPSKPGFYQHFQNGSIYWSAATGAHVVRAGAIRDKWASLSWENGYLGFPTGDMTSIPGGWYTHFQGGTIFWSSTTGAKVVKGAIRSKYQAMGWHTSLLGYPTTDEVAVPGGFYNHFQNGSIYWSSGTGAHWIRSAIRTKWSQMGAQGSLLGFPTTDETAVQGGAFNHFSGGSIYHSTATGAHFVRGPIRDKWASLGWELSSLGFPTSDEVAVTELVETTTTAADGSTTTTIEEVATGALYNDFSGGSVYSSPDTGAHMLRGAVREHWLSEGGPASDLGLPVGDQFAIPAGTRQDFTRGQLILDPVTAEFRFCTVTGTSGPDTLTGTDGDDVICGLGGDDTIDALGGNDSVVAGEGNDVVDLGAGSDLGLGEAGDDVLRGQDGDDGLLGDAGADHLVGDAGIDDLVGGDGADRLDGGPADDLLDGGAGEDVLSGDDGADELSGGGQVDTLSGGADADRLAGGGGDDTLSGGGAADTVSGGGGQDALNGDGGDDHLLGGGTSDVTDGGDGADVCTVPVATSVSCETPVENTEADAAHTTTADAVVHAGAATAEVVPFAAAGENHTSSNGVDVEGGTVRLSTVSGISLQAPVDPAVEPTLSSEGTLVSPGAASGLRVEVQALAGGSARVFTIAEEGYSASAQHEYAYTVHLPEGAWLEAGADGTVSVMQTAELVTDGLTGSDVAAVDLGAMLPEVTAEDQATKEAAVAAADGQAPPVGAVPLEVFAAPWAVDADGQALPTRFEVRGSQLVQVVDTTAAAFPVVSDPLPLIGIGLGVAARLLLGFLFKSAPKFFVTTAIRVGVYTTRNGFRYFDDFKKAAGGTKPGYQWHHIVEQGGKNRTRFDPRALHNPNNLVQIPKEVHQQCINRWMSRSNVRLFGHVTGRDTLRYYLRGKSFETQHRFGIELLRLCGVPI